ncbi:MAG: asparagine synthase (glutamine-hydrolyzing) [Proteobacteria bacterium]|nr:asparagine synthase (glutamine-hydrolyzing) [Pseudomonadota bacterium]NOG59076.1 asparagine synthase (glutamine-hydrolyzing) [Pseudomonadota bacterium]
MCGITGLINFKEEQVDHSNLKDMTECLSHRGPDDSGYFFDDNVAFGFKRLSIIDVEHGHQPMQTIDKDYTIVFNGEIYNFKAVRDTLKGYGYHFQTNCDTEVILYAYKHWGRECLDKFNGMFAFAIYNKKEQCVFIARDRLGIKPLYYTFIGETMLFASEMKSILQHPGFVRKPNYNAISSYLTFRYPLGEQPVFDDIKRLSPGNFMILNKSGINIRKYWEIPFIKNKEDRGEAFYLNKISELLLNAVERRMISDVPIGALLSGGLDSSIIVALMSKLSDDKVKTYSIGFNEDGYDESYYSNLVAKHCGVDHLSLTLTQDDYIQKLQNAILIKDSPLSIPHEVALYEICKELKKYTTVVISGEGADELFGGYGRVQRSPMDYKKIQFVNKYFPESIRSSMLKIMGAGNRSEEWLSINSHMQHFFSVYHWFSFEEKSSIFTDDMLGYIDNDKSNIEYWENDFNHVSGGNEYDAILYAFEKNHLTCLLDRLDSMSMAAGVEARVPFVDHELIEFVSTIPFKYKMRWKSPLHKVLSIFSNSFNASEVLDDSKYILRKFGATILPSEIAFRKKKGFPVPLDSWVNKGMKSYAKEILLDDVTIRRGIFRADMVEKLINNKQNIKYDFWGKKIWMLLNLEIWFRELVDK